MCSAVQCSVVRPAMQLVPRMDPDVESVVCFPGTARLTHLTYGTKQLISHQIELEKMRRLDVAKAAAKSLERSHTEVTPARASQARDQGLEAPVTPRGAKKTLNHLVTLSAKPVEVKSAVPTDFFGRVIKVGLGGSFRQA